MTKIQLTACLSALLCCLTLSLGSCAKIPESTKEEKTAVLSLDEYEVPYEQFRYFVKNHMRDRAGETDVESYYTPQRVQAEQEEIYTETITALSEQYAILSLAKQHGIDRESAMITETVEAAVQTAINSYGDEKTYAADLAANFMTDQVYRFFMTVQACREELYFSMLNAGELTEDTAALRALIEGDKFVRVKQILLTVDAGETDEDVRARAEEAQKRAAAGEDFDALVAEYGEDLFMFRNTDGYYICRGVWDHAFEDTAFTLSVGEVSDVIETAVGYSILFRAEKDPAYLSAHFDDLATDYRDAQFSRAIEARAAEMTVTRRPELAAYSLTEMP